MEKKKIIGSMILVILMITGFMLYPKKEKSDTQSTVNESTISIQKEQVDSHVKEKTSSYAENECREAAERFVRIKNEGSSKDVYIDRLSPVKELLSKELYQSLVPSVSNEELVKMREENERIKDEETTKTSVERIESATHKIMEDEFEIYVLYTISVEQPNARNVSRYLMRLRVQWNQQKARIYRIIEDSKLGNGLYT